MKKIILFIMIIGFFLYFDIYEEEIEEKTPSTQRIVPDIPTKKISNFKEKQKIQRWKQLLSRNLSRFKEKEVKVSVEEENDDNHYKQVLITYRFSNGKENSFRALVDSRTGIIERTWDRTIHEKRNPVRFTLPE